MERYTFLYVPYNPLEIPVSYLGIPTHVLMWPSCFRSYTFRYTFLYVPVRSMSCVGSCSTSHGQHDQSRSATGPIERNKILSTVIRSYTFRATPPAFVAKCDAKSYVPIRSSHVPIRSLEALLQMCPKVIRSYTFQAKGIGLYGDDHTNR